MSDLCYPNAGSFPVPFSLSVRVSRTEDYPTAVRPFISFSTQRELRRLRRFSGGGNPRRPIVRLRKPGLRCRRAYPHCTGILTRFPFAFWVLPERLGRADPKLINIIQERVPFSPLGLSPRFCSYYHRDYYNRKVQQVSRSAFNPNDSPRYRIKAVNLARGCRERSLAPSIFPARRLELPAVTRCLAGGCF